MVLKKFLLEIVVFIVGAAVMILELTGSRVLAPYMGTSIFVWTSLIGIVLGSLSLGYFWGGKLADKVVNYKVFSLLIFFGAIFVGLTALLKELILFWIQGSVSDLRVGSIIATLLLFAPASVLLGMISPYAVRLKLKNISRSGRTVGSLYAVSTVGSIFGTFLTGFFLISYLGNTKILYLLSLILVFTSVISYIRGFLKIKLMVVFILLAALFAFANLEKANFEGGFIDVDTQYNRVLIFNSRDTKNNKEIRELLIDPLTVQSAMYLDSDELVFEYSKFYHLARYFNRDFKKALLIGGAGYSFPKDFLRVYDEATLDVVEIDSKMTDLAKAYFRLKDNDRLEIYHEDGRTFLNRGDGKYDVIYGDAFGSTFSLPHQLTTKEAIEKMFSLLEDDGVVLVNIISSIEGETGKFLRSEYFTFKAIFPQVYLFPTVTNDGKQVQNVLLVALKSPKPVIESNDAEISGYLEHMWTGGVDHDVGILTDEYAPVDQYMIPLIVERTRRNLDKK